MLGSAISRALRRQNCVEYKFDEKFEWFNLHRLKLQFEAAAGQFFRSLASGDRFEVYWAAGIGFMGSTSSQTDSEHSALRQFLAALNQELVSCRASGTFAYASSAGALYAPHDEKVITEATPINSISPYASSKAAQEKDLRAFANRSGKIRLLISRFSTLYGPGQAYGKPQGLITKLIRQSFKNEALQIIVPLDTARDYLFVDDAAKRFIASCEYLNNVEQKQFINIIASEKIITISEIISTLNRVLRRRPRIIHCRSALSDSYPSKVVYKSLYTLTPDPRITDHSFIEGMCKLVQAERSQYVSGKTAQHHTN